MIWPLYTTHSSFLLLLHPHWPHFGLFYAPCTIISIILALKVRDRILASPLRQPACWRTFAHASLGMFFPPFWAWLISTLSWHIPLHITLTEQILHVLTDLLTYFQWHILKLQLWDLYKSSINSYLNIVSPFMRSSYPVLLTPVSLVAGMMFSTLPSTQ